MTFQLALVTATFNSGDTLPKTLDSLAPFGDDVLSVFVDGNSSDNTLELIQRDPRINFDAARRQVHAGQHALVDRA